MKLSSDVVVIGGGMAGLVAGMITAQAGLHTVLVTRGHGATANSSGAIDILGYLPLAGTPISSPMEGLFGITSLYPFHPYSMLGVDSKFTAVDTRKVIDSVSAAVDWFVDKMSRSVAPYVGSLDKTIWPVTPIGSLKPTALVQSTMDTKSLYMDSDAVVLFVGIRGLPDFHSTMAAKAFLEARMTAAEGPHRVVNCTVDLSVLGLDQEVSAMIIAHRLDYGSIEQFTSILSSHVEAAGATHVLLPSILGIHNAVRNLDYMEKSLDVDVIELLGLPPSVPGARLQLALETEFVNSGGELLRGHEVISGRFEGGRLRTLYVRTPARSIEIDASSFILASGKFIGGGLVGTDEGLREPIFDLQVYDAHRTIIDGIRPQRLTERVSISERGHRLFGCGIGVDETLRPLNIDGLPYAENLYCAGSILAGHNWPLEKCGLGVALATGYAAGKAVIMEVEQ